MATIFVLASLRSSTYRTAYASPLRLLRRLLAERRVSARGGWAGENDGHFDHPAGYPDIRQRLSSKQPRDGYAVFAGSDGRQRHLGDPAEAIH
jgi:hypothetical protein